MRRKILEGDNIKPEIERLMKEMVRELTQLPAKNNPKFYVEFNSVFPVEEKKLTKVGEEKKDKTRFDNALALANELYDGKEKEIEADTLRKVERDVYIQVLDTLWMQHLENMQHLRDGIHWRSVGQRDPLVEYRSESQKLFDGLQSTLREEVLRSIMHVHKHDATAQVTDNDHETELTRLAERAVERGVNEVDSGETNRDDDFKITKVKSANENNRVKNTAKKKKKTQRQNKKKARR